MLAKEKIRKLRGQAHALRPVVMLGSNGLTEAVLKEINLALDHHELIKIKVSAERDARKQITADICRKTRAELIQNIGQMSVLFRKNPDKSTR